MKTQIVMSEMKTEIELAFYLQALNKDIDIPTWAYSVNAMAQVISKISEGNDYAQFLNNCGWRLVFGVDAQ